MKKKAKGQMTAEEKLSHDLRSLAWRAEEALANLWLDKLLELESEVHQFNDDRAERISIRMWDTLIWIADERRKFRANRMKDRAEVPRESFYSIPEMPYGTRPEYKVPTDSIADEILTLPYGDPEYNFEWSKILDHGRRDKSKSHPRVVIHVCGNQVREVSSDLPVEYIVMHELSNVRGKDGTEAVNDNDSLGTSSASSSEPPSENCQFLFLGGRVGD
jgi:hypothetical protein